MSDQRQPCPFPDADGEKVGMLESKHDDLFFEEALADHPHSAFEPTKSFVGSIIERKRFRLLVLLLVGIFGLFVAKTSALQLFQGESYRLLAEENRIYRQVLPAERGVIYDRNGIVLADNEPTFQLVASKASMPEDEYERQLTLSQLASVIDVDARDLLAVVDEAEDDDEQLLLHEDLAYDKAMYLASQEQTYPWLQLEMGSKRSYITDGVPSLSHVLGYTGIINEAEYEEKESERYRRFDHIGKQGLEEEYETYLRGIYGEELVEVDALGGIERIVSKIDPIDGEDLYLTIDAPLQAEIESVLQARLEGTEATRASVVVMEPTTGEVLALVSWPAFDANDFTSGIDEETYSGLINDEDRPLFPRATSGEYPSGSTIKPSHAAAALMEDIITPSTSFLSTGGIRISLWFFPDWRAGGHGVTDVYHAIADSVNTFFYLIGGGNETFNGLGIEKMMAYDAQFGFGAQTGIDLPGEAEGFLPSKDWKEEAKGEQWYIGDTYHAAIGQGDFLVTPLQIARSTAMFANGGSLVTPHVNAELEPTSQEVVPSDIAEVIRDAMRGTVTYGSATYLQNVPTEVAGKTGTAQWSTAGVPHSWFTGFAPFNDPEIAITVLIEEGGDDYLSVPVTSDVLNWWFADRPDS